MLASYWSIFFISLLLTLLLARYLWVIERLSWILNYIEGQQVEGEQGCGGDLVPDY